MRETLLQEFDHQTQNLLDKGYPNLSKLSEPAFLELLQPLKTRLTSQNFVDSPTTDNHIPFVIVIKNELVPTESAMSLVHSKNTTGIVDMNPVAPAHFQPLPDLSIPTTNAYLLVDIDTGQSTLNVTPTAALQQITHQQRFPLTIDEGIALVTHYPEILTDKQKYNAFSMLGSRANDQKVPALWISYGKPRLGWCWANNPHTWLGSASCRARLET